MMVKLMVFLKKNIAYTRLIKMILAQYPRRQPTTTSVKQSRADSGTCMVEQESGRNPFFCRQKGHEEVPRSTKDSLWSNELWNHSTS